MTDTPTCIETEQKLLGSMILDNQAFNNLPSFDAEIFYQESHRIIYTAMQQCWNEENICTLDLIAMRLVEMKKLDQVGGIPYLIGLADSPYTSYTAYQFYEEVREYYLKREVVRASQFAIQKALSGPSADALSFLETEAVRLTKNPDDAMSVSVELERAFNYATGAMLTPTGYPTLDMLLGGLPPDITVIAASNSHLKTALAYGMALKIGKRNISPDGRGFVAVASPDQPLSEVLANQAAKLCGIPVEVMGAKPDGNSRLSTDALETYRKAVMELRSKFLPYVHVKSSSFTPDSLYEYFLRQIKLGASCLMLDSLQALSTSRGSNPTETFGYAMRILKDLSLKFQEIPIVVLSQVNLEVEKRPMQLGLGRRPLLSDMSYAPKVIKDLANVVLLLYYPEKDEPTDDEIVELQVCIGKRKSGRADNWRSAVTKLAVQKKFAHVMDWKTIAQEKIKPYSRAVVVPRQAPVFQAKKQII